MQLVYEAANTIEAHMILNLLEQQGLSGRIDGEYLLGGVGELPAVGLVRVLVEDADFPAAREIIKEWELTQSREIRKPERVTSRKPFSILLVGVMIGIVLMYLYYHLPFSSRSYDSDKNKITDISLTYSPSGNLLKTNSDRNQDGKIDLIVRYDSQGWASAAESDDNFDGFFETHTRYEMGKPAETGVDTNQDGRVDYRNRYVNGVLTTAEYLDDSGNRIIKIEYYRLSKLSHAELDMDNDGRFDKRIIYTDHGEIKAVELLTSQP